MSRYSGWVLTSIVVAIFALTAIARTLGDVMVPEPTAYPTYTLYPTHTPYATHTPQPTYTFFPTVTSTATYTPVPEPKTWKGIGASYYPDFCVQMRDIVGKEGWAYNWGPWPGTLSKQGHVSGDHCAGVEFVAARQSCEGVCTELWPGEYLIALNEPIAQYHKTVEWAVDQLVNLHHCHPTRKKVVINEWDLQVTREILDRYVAKYGEIPSDWILGVHIYGNINLPFAISEARRIIEEGFALVDEFNMAGLWITEFGYAQCWTNIEDSAEYVATVTDMALIMGVDRIAPFQAWYSRNEQWAPGFPEGIAEECNMSLIADDGLLTLIGEAYKAK